MSVKFNKVYSPLYTRPNKLYLYNRGDLCTDITGGWATPTYTGSSWTIRVTFETNYISYRGSSGSLFELLTYNTFAIENIKKLVCIREFKTNNTGANKTGYHGLYFCSKFFTNTQFRYDSQYKGTIITGPGSEWNTDPATTSSLEEVTMSYAVCLKHTLDVSNITTTGQFYVNLDGGHSGSSDYGRIHEIYLEMK